MRCCLVNDFKRFRRARGYLLARCHGLIVDRKRRKKVVEFETRKFAMDCPERWLGIVRVGVPGWGVGNQTSDGQTARGAAGSTEP